jgi:hypothetical protein
MLSVIMLNVTDKPFVLSVVMLNVVMLSLVAPHMLQTYSCKQPYSVFAVTFTRLQQDLFF